MLEDKVVLTVTDREARTIGLAIKVLEAGFSSPDLEPARRVVDGLLEDFDIQPLSTDELHQLAIKILEDWQSSSDPDAPNQQTTKEK